MKRDSSKRFILVMGIVFILGGLNLIYLYSFSHTKEYLAVAIINLVIGLIFIISNKKPKLQKILIKN
ncbi:MAG: hypothetical protein NKF70_09995 [Methanobacterium sp. ERen5]|nr:MAG: hypothetical protein NKF70_09995 [Methanobacterium sp. ERen5]